MADDFKRDKVKLFLFGKMPFSSHSHSGEFCTHGCGRLKEIVSRAVGLGFTHYGLSEHMPRYRNEDLYENEVEDNISPDNLVEMFDRYIQEARRLQREYKGDIDLLVGMETEYISKETVYQIKKLKVKYSLDYLVGSMHHVNGMQIDYSKEEYLKTEVKCGGTEATMMKYYDEQYEMLREVQPEIIGHFDLISLYRPGFEFTDRVWDKIKRNIEFGVSYGALFEVNTAYRPGNPFPRPDVMKVLKASGARLTISDDSHYPGGVGWCYGHLPQYLQSFGINEIYFLESCTDETGNVMKGKAVIKKMDNCWDNKLWKNKELLSDGWCSE